MDYNPKNFNTTMKSEATIKHALTNSHTVKVSIKNQHVFILHDGKIAHVYKGELLDLGGAIYNAIMREQDYPHLHDDCDYIESTCILNTDSLWLDDKAESAYI